MKYNITINSIINAMKELERTIDAKEQQIKMLTEELKELKSKGENCGCDCC